MAVFAKYCNESGEWHELKSSQDPRDCVSFELLNPAGLPLGRLRADVVTSAVVGAASLLRFELALPFLREPSTKRLRLALSTQDGKWKVEYLRGDLNLDLFEVFFDHYEAGYNNQVYVGIPNAVASVGEWLRNKRRIDGTNNPFSSAQQLPSDSFFCPQPGWWLQHVPSDLAAVHHSRCIHNIGLFSVPADATAANLVLCIVAATDTGRGRWLSLESLDEWSLTQNQIVIQHLLYMPLGAEPKRGEDWAPQWHVVAQVPPYDANRMQAQVRRGVVTPDGHPVQMILDKWNLAVAGIQQGKPRRAGLPFLPLPRLSIIRLQHGDGAVPAFHFTARGNRVDPSVDWPHAQVSWDSSLAGCGIHSISDQHEVRLEFALSGPDPFLDPVQFNLTLAGKFSTNSPAWLTTIDESAGKKGEMFVELDVKRYWDETRVAGGDGDVAVEFSLQDLVVGTATELRFGSLEFQFGPDLVIPNNATTCRMHGTWSATKCDLYPEIDITMPARMRFAPTDDASVEERTATFDVDELAEDRLQRESSALLAREGGKEYPFTGTLQMRMVTKPGLDPVIELTYRTTSDAQRGTGAFYLNAKPFTVAMIQPIRMDPEAGDILAEWRSDDPKGAQWRLGVTEVNFLFPPQAVGEEMERGKRFWSTNGSEINPGNVVGYRFSRPAKLSVRPGTVARRYVPNPANLREILRESDVRQLTVEMLYPVEAEFATDSNLKPLVRIGEVGEFMGNPAPNLPRPREERNRKGDRLLDRTTSQLFSSTLADWVRMRLPSDDFLDEVGKTRASQAASRATFVSRMGVYSVYNPFLPDRQLGLREGLKFTFRGRKEGAPPTNPLSFSDAKVQQDLSAEQKAELGDFLEGNDWTARADGAIIGGALHTFEFPSELAAVLRTRESTEGILHKLSLSALGATGNMEAAFDEGRTTFAPTVANGQLSRLVKTRIGRIGVVWNLAKHVIVYERTTTSSRQFEDEQDHTLDNWPVLRKTEEYVDILQPRRFFDEEPSADENRCGPLAASAFVTKRIYVNGAWGRDLGHGYELPLWSPGADQTIYPKPVHVLEGSRDPGDRARHINDCPQHLYFYSNTEKGTGSDPDRWKHQLHVDTCNLWNQASVTAAPQTGKTMLDGGTRQLAGGIGLPERFNFRVVAESALDLQHGRSEKPMLARLNEIFISRSATMPRDPHSTEPDGIPAEIKQLLEGAPKVGVFTGEEIIARLRAKCEAIQRCVPVDCAKAKKSLQDFVDKELGTLAHESLVGIWNPKQETDKLVSQLTADIGAIVLQNRIVAMSSVGQWRIMLDRAASLPEQDAARARKALAASITDFEQFLFDPAKGKLTEPGRVLDSAGKALMDSVTALAKAVNAVGDVDVQKPAATILKKAEEARAALALARGALGRVTTPQLAPHIGRLRDLVAFLEMCASQAASLSPLIAANEKKLQLLFTDILKSASTIVRTVNDIVSTLKAAFDQLMSTAVDGCDALKVQSDTVVALLENATAQNAPAAIARCRDLIGPTAKGEGRIVDWVLERQAEVERQLGTFITTMQAQLNTMADAAKVLQDKLGEAMRATLFKLQEVAQGIIDGIGNACEKVNNVLGDIQKQVEQWGREQERELTFAVAELARSDAARRLKAFAEETASSKLLDKGTSALKLARAVGELPKLPELSFDIRRGEYAFKDLEKQIETSPFVAKLRDVEGHLKDLGVAVACQNLRDQFLPVEDLGGPNFQQVMKDVGGILPSGGLFNFKIDSLSAGEMVVTHDFDPETRSGWVKARLDKDFGNKDAFTAGPVAVRVNSMHVSGAKDVQLASDGTVTSSGFGKIKGDWILNFGGQDIVTFGDVSVNYDGNNGFTFDVNPSNIRLHPTLQFISDVANQFGEKIPPNVQILRDDRGMPSGVSASFFTPVRDLPPTPPVKIGPFDIASGLALGIRQQGRFEISAHCGLGSREKPVYVEVNKLGGGFFVQARATYEDGRIVPTASLGLALGSQESFNLAGVARGSYSIFFFAYLSVSSAQGGASFAVGVSINGSARILGIANASVSLLLEVVREGGGATRAHGELDVSIEICWCYTLHVNQQVTRDI